MFMYMYMYMCGICIHVHFWYIVHVHVHVNVHGPTNVYTYTCTCPYSTFILYMYTIQVCGTQMDGLTHEQAVGVLKATPKTVQLKIEKGVLPEDSHSPQRNSVEVQVHVHVHL